MVRLSTQFVGDHGRLGLQRRHDTDPAATHLQGAHQRTEVAVTGEQHDMVQILDEAHGVDRQLDVHVAFDLAAAQRVGEFLGGLGHHRVTIVV